MKIFIVGGTGFLGRHFQEELKKHPDIEAVFAVRGSDEENAVRNAGFQAVFADIQKREEIIKAARGAQILYNLVGIISGTREDFYNLHVKGTENVIAAAKANGAKKIVYVSALGVENPKGARIPYFTTKLLAEEAIKQSGIPYVILRPSAMFGKGSGFLRQLAVLINLSPIIFLPDGGKYRIQLVAACVTASILAQSALQEKTEGVYTVSGPEVLTLKEILKRLLIYLHKKRVILPVTFRFAAFFVKIFSLLGVKNLITSSELAMLRLENVGDNGDAQRVFNYPVIYFDPNGSYPLI